MKTVLTLLFVITSLSIHAQDNHEKRQERIHALKVGFLTEKLDLSSQEAQGFWPIYNEFDKKIETLRHREFEALRTYRQGGENISDEKALEILNTLVEVQEKRAIHKTGLAENLKKIIPIRKVIALFKAEEDFKRQLLRELRNRKDKRSRD